MEFLIQKFIVASNYYTRKIEGMLYGYVMLKKDLQVEDREEYYYLAWASRIVLIMTLTKGSIKPPFNEEI
ncbi:hypothetical protein BH18THE2_BH18THE2_26950 [soil metagenome]